MYKIYFNDIEKFMNKRITGGPIVESNYISSVMKNKRLELSMTLSQTTDNICSEAFLSKLERNMMDKKNERVALLCERLDLDYNRLLEIEEGNRISQLLLHYINDNRKEIEKLKEGVTCELFIAQDYIIRGYNYYFREEYKQLHQIIIELDQVKQCLCDMELFAVLILIVEYDIKTLQYNKAHSYLHFAERLLIKDELYQLIIIEKKFIIAAHTESVLLEGCYATLKTMYSLGYPLSKQFLMNVYYLQAATRNDNLEALQIMKNDIIPQTYYDDYVYAIFYVFVKKEKYDEAINFIQGHNNFDYRTITLLAYCIFKTLIGQSTNEELRTQKGKLVGYLRKAEQKPTDTFHLAFIRLMQYEIDQVEMDVICNYIKNYLLKEMEDFYYPLYNHYIEERYCELLGKLSRYKDAYLFLSSKRKNLKKLPF